MTPSEHRVGNPAVKICQLTSLSIVKVLRAVACLCMAGCAQSPSPMPAQAALVASVYRACDIDPGVWKQIKTPLQREALIELADERSGGAIRKYFFTSKNDRESWFKDPSGNLLACRYMKAEECGGGMISTVIFRRTDKAWKAEPTISKICGD